MTSVKIYIVLPKLFQKQSPSGVYKKGALIKILLNFNGILELTKFQIIS